MVEYMLYCGDDNYICVIGNSVVSHIHSIGSRIYTAAYNHNGFKSTSSVSSLLFFSMFCTNWSWRWAYPACCPSKYCNLRNDKTPLSAYWLYIIISSWLRALSTMSKVLFLVLNSMLMLKPSLHAILTVNRWVVYHLKNKGTYQVDLHGQNWPLAPQCRYPHLKCQVPY